MRRFNLFRIVLKRSGVNKVAIGFLATYAICALVVLIAEPGVDTYGDALWFLWAVSLTVGLGDFTAVTTIGRVATICCSLYALMATAITTAVVVDYFNERRAAELDASAETVLHKLEHLDELDKDELRAISEKIKKLRK